MGARTRGFANNVLTAGKIDASDGLSGVVPNSNVNNTSVSGVTSLPPSVGSGIASVSSNPAAPVATGIIWYNTSDERFKVAAVSKAFASQVPYPAAQSEFSGSGTATAAIFVAGSRPPPGYTNECHTWNGIGFSNIANYPETQYGSATLGITTAALSFGGRPPSPPAFNQVTAEFDGTSWTAGGNYPTVIRNASTAGTQTAGLGFTGNLTNPGSPYKTNISAEYDGSSWTVGNTVNTERRNASGGGTQTAALLVGGFGDPGGSTISAFEKYDGTSWTSDPASLNTGRYGHTTQMGVTGDNAITAGGATPSLTGKAEQYNGTSWSETGDMATARNMCAGSGTSTTHLALGGSGSTAPVANVEEFNESSFVFTAAAWASGGNLNTGRNAGAGFGIQTAAVMTAGNLAPETNATEEYDGSSWTSVNNYPISKRFLASCGTLTSGLIAGGSPLVATVNKYDGTNYSSANNLPTTTDGGTMFGTQTAAVFTVGRTPTVTSNTYEFDGTNWTAGGAAGTARYFLDSSGILTAGLIFGGQTSGPTARSETEEYDGTSWSESGDLGTARYGIGGSSAGTQTDTIAFAGNNPAVVLTEGYDGTSWSTRPNMATARRFISGAGTGTAGIGFGGNPPNNSTEEFTGETSTLNVENVTDS